MTERENDVPDALEGVAALYGQNVREHGGGPLSVGWRDEETQALRFAKLLEVVEPAAAVAGFSVNDLGCGYGAMFEYMAGREDLSVAEYRGFDISDEMLTLARERITDARCTFVDAAALDREADYSFVSGTFNVRLEASDAQWKDYVRACVRDLAEHSGKGFAFNLLTTYVDWKDPKLFYADPMEWFDFCKREISPRVSLLHDYPLYEWTLLVRMEQP